MSSPAKETEVPFSFFVELVQAIAAIKPHRAADKQPRSTRWVDTPTYKTFKRWLGALRERYAPLPAGMTTIVFRLLFPEEDVRRKYGLQEIRMAQYLTKILGVSTAAGGRGERLRKWKGEDALGCLGNEVERVMDGRSIASVSSISLCRVDSLLSELAGKCAYSAEVYREGTHMSRRSREAILSELYTSLTPAKSAVMTQIILKDLRPLLYPIPQSACHYTSALLEYKSNAVAMLTKESAMHAWDSSGRMSLIFKTRANLEEAATAFEGLNNGEVFPQPTVGVQIQIPKCVKGQGPAQSLKSLKGADKVWVETKYDGERAQIHVWFDDDGDPRIRIFSKSGRDSTLDRAGIHSIVYAALGIPYPGSYAEADAQSSDTLPFKRGIVVEAEMVAYSDALGRIDEFWRIRSLIARTAIGVRHRSPPPGPSTQEEVMETQCSLISNGTDGGTRHLALVFFDILLLDDASLLPVPYGQRREVLERLINVKPGYAMLAERTCIDTTLPNGEEMLRRAFARVVADHQEGVVIKADDAGYAEKRWPWVKLKQDYIPGHGDAVDLVLLGASWEKERARELRVPPTAYTTFYFGALSNADELKKHPNRLPHFEIIFTSSYGLDRAQLEELIFLIQNSDSAPYRHQAAASLSYTHTLSRSLSPPTVLLREPLLAELFGAGFTKSPGNRFYELRFPRIAKIFRPSDRPWLDGTTLPEFQQIARTSVGRDRTGKAEDDWAHSIFRPDVPPSPGLHCPVKRKRTEDMWVERLALVDAKVGSRSPTKRMRIDVPPTRVTQGVRRENAENETGPSASVAAAGASGSPRQRVGMLRLDSVTNVVSFPPPLAPPSTSPLSRRRNKDPCAPEPSNRPQSPPSSPPRLNNPIPSQPPAHMENTNQPFSLNAPGYSGTPTDRLIVLTHSNEGMDAPQPQDPSARAPTPDELYYPSVQERPLDPVPFIPTARTLYQFLHNSVVWLARPDGAPRPAWRAASQAIIPPSSRVNTLEAVVLACGWSETLACAWAARGVVFVDDSQDGGAWSLQETMKELAALRAAALNAGKAAACKPVFLLSMTMLAHDALTETATVEEWESRAICRFG
ncbi:uncharacterized protein TRAVEDRAFT_124375 [Trametes versicolor FP-101664 SS1]|uniref:uncharacterized protein n=1 Tax=Trametes versicolor (strain FP-101664) TaxID=717944 RepID=UPI0004624231|nr:uncharacterized protein TRAVEDRAFT_124375 [Trametes versicolor FP-101664 SS1]EIW58323.1 hypothetical protein TRAVEDRAFT_124375 [Trametes versicolor FP-101664 SS1]